MLMNLAQCILIKFLRRIDNEFAVFVHHRTGGSVLHLLVLHQEEVTAINNHIVTGQPGARLTIYSVVTCVHRNESAGGVRP